MGRMPVFARKPAPDAGDDAPDTTDDAPAPSGDGDTVTCPNCHCEFDPANPEDYTMPGDKGTDLGQAAAYSDAPDAQAPVGEDAVTAAVAAALRGH